MPIVIPCSQPGCAALAHYRGRCELHARNWEQRRGTTTQRGYDGAWQRLRRMVLADEPLCRHCAAADRITIATEVDHIVPLDSAPHLRLERSNLQPLCHPCHDAKTRLQ